MPAREKGATRHLRHHGRIRTAAGFFDDPPFNVMDGTLFPDLQDLLARMERGPSLRVVVFESPDPRSSLTHKENSNETVY